MAPRAIHSPIPLLCALRWCRGGSLWCFLPRRVGWRILGVGKERRFSRLELGKGLGFLAHKIRLIGCMLLHCVTTITRMERLVADIKEQVLDENFCQKLAEEFNCSAGRVGSRALQATQVQGWFLNKFPASITKLTCLPTATEEKALDSQENVLVSETKAPASEEKVLALDTSISNNEDEVSPDSPKGTRDKVPELEDLEFEARSAKDSAWYDVDIFLAHRRTNSGEVEVRVRFQGFGAEEDEWVNVMKAIRQRSIPLESSECRRVVEGDLVLCFKERNEEALHFDAHILEIQRKQHDIRGCRCVFLVKYDHDQSQERVKLGRLSRRPKYF